MPVFKEGGKITIHRTSDNRGKGTKLSDKRRSNFYPNGRTLQIRQGNRAWTLTLGQDKHTIAGNWGLSTRKSGQGSGSR